jgi:hypothetical protein
MGAKFAGRDGLLFDPKVTFDDAAPTGSSCPEADAPAGSYVRYQQRFSLPGL